MNTIDILGRKAITQTTQLAVLAALTLGLVVAGQQAPATAHANPCLQGFVYRDAYPNDEVCVTPNIRTETAQENADAGAHVQPGGGAYGANTCAAGYVFRDAYPGDQVCVTPAERDEAAADNAAANARQQPNPPAPPPPPAPPAGSNPETVTYDGDLLGVGLRVHVKDNVGQPSQCDYNAAPDPGQPTLLQPYAHEFSLPANGTTSWAISSSALGTPAVVTGTHWQVTVDCHFATGNTHYGFEKTF
jgi:hypothetical protein